MNTASPLPRIPAKVRLTANYLTLTVKDHDDTIKIKVPVLDGTVDLTELDIKVGDYFAAMLQKEFEKTALRRKLLGQSDGQL